MVDRRRRGRAPRRRRPRARPRDRRGGRPAASKRGSTRARSRASRTAIAVDVPCADSRPRRARRGPRPLPGRSPHRAAPPSAGRGSRPPRPGRSRAAAISAASCSSSSSRRASSRGSIASSASAARFARQRSTAAAISPALRRGRRTRRAGRAASARRAAAAARAGRGSRRADRPPRPAAPRSTVSSSSRAVERPAAATSRTAISGSGIRSKSASTRAASAPWRTSVVSARAPSDEPERVDEQALAGAGLAGDHVQPGAELRRSRSISARSVTVSSSSRPVVSRRQQLDLVAEEVPERTRALRLDEPDRALHARTSTTSPTASGMSSRPSIETSASCASTTRQRTAWVGPTTTERMADR